MKPRNRQTIYDIALKAGASPSTVSSALNGTWQKRRINRDTVDRIKKIALEEGYSVNLQARGLRKARSGLAGMILPEHENRFFSALSQAFANEARKRELCPAIVLSGRDPDEQAKAITDLIAYSVEMLVIAGASEPEALATFCRDAGVPHVFVDQPCATAPSVVSDNHRGAHELTMHLLGKMRSGDADDPRSHLYFLGGAATSYATKQRLAGFRDAVAFKTEFFGDHQIITCGYNAARSRRALERLCETLGRLPAGLFVNSISSFDGLAQHLRELPTQALSSCVIGCYDYEPFGSLLSFPVHMIRQRSDVIISEAFRHFDEEDFRSGITEIRPELLLSD